MKPFARWCIWTGSVLAGLTGMVYWWMVHMMEPVSEFAVINHPLQPWVLKAHIVTSPLLVFALGIIATDHVWRQYRLGIRAGRRSGTSAMWLSAPMIVSGYLVQAITTPLWLSAVAWLHLGTGIAFLVGVGIHQLVVPRRRGRRIQREVDLPVVATQDRPAGQRRRREGRTRPSGRTAAP